MHPRILGVFATAALTLSCAAVTTVLNPAPTATPTAEPVGLPTFETDRDAFDQAFDEGAKALWDLTNENVDEDLSEPGTLHYTVDLRSDATVDIVTGWCAQTASILQENLEHFMPIIVVDGRSLAPSEAQTFEWEVNPGEDPDHPEGQECKSWEVLASDWPVGTHTVTEGWTLDAAINDGDSPFAAGDYLYEYTVSVTE